MLLYLLLRIQQQTKTYNKKNNYPHINAEAQRTHEGTRKSNAF